MKNKKFWNFQNMVENEEGEVEEVELMINGEIVNIPCWEGDVSSNTFKAELDQYPNAKKITVGLNTPGGDVFEAIAIGNHLKNHPGKTEAKLYALCASAGTIIANSCDTVVSYDNAIFMIHDPMTVGAGGIKDFEKTVQRLQTAKASIIKTYKNHSTLSEEEIANLMTEETWMTAEEALENGFVTEVLSSNVDSEKVENIQNLMHGQVFKNFKKLPTGMFKNLIKVTNTIKKENKPKEAKVVNLDQLKKDHPDLYNQVKTEIENSERERVDGILNLKRPGAEDIINNAIKNGKTKEEVAFEILNNDSLQTRAKAEVIQNNLETEAEEVEPIEVETPKNEGEEDLDAVVNTAIARANSKI